jgi:hypothetical protein
MRIAKRMCVRVPREGSLMNLHISEAWDALKEFMSPAKATIICTHCGREMQGESLDEQNRHLEEHRASNAKANADANERLNEEFNSSRRCGVTKTLLGTPGGMEQCALREGHQGRCSFPKLDGRATKPKPKRAKDKKRK